MIVPRSGNKILMANLNEFVSVNGGCSEASLEIDHRLWRDWNLHVNDGHKCYMQKTMQRVSEKTGVSLTDLTSRRMNFHRVTQASPAVSPPVRVIPPHRYQINLFQENK